MLRGIDKLISQVTKMPVRVCNDPIDCVALGTGRCLEKNVLGV